MHARKTNAWTYCGVLSVAVMMAWTTTALAASFTVTKTADTNDGACNADCSLREAISAANANPGADSITVPAGNYVLTLLGSGEDFAATGDLDIRGGVTLTGAGAATTIIDGNGTSVAPDRVLHIISGSVSISAITIQNGNSGDFGGGIFAFSGPLTLTNSMLTGNSASNGGGIFNSTTTTLTNSTLSGNSAGSGNGGGIYSLSGTVALTNSTLSGNSAPSGTGGGIYGLSGTVALTNSTLSGNSAPSGAGGGIFSTNATITLTNSIVANSTSGGNCAGSSITDHGHNLDSDGSCGVGPVTNPLLAPAGLANNGGPTQTIALLLGSPAIDGGSDAACAAPPVNGLDQRGLLRPGAGHTHCSIGAYEFSFAPTPTSTPTATPTKTPGGPVCTCLGDANKNRFVNSTDFAAVQANFGRPADPLTGLGDANCNGFVNASDFAAVQANFGRPCP